VVAFVIASTIRRMAVELDATSARVVSLVKEQERLRHARLLHDRVLQTVETLAAGDWIDDREVRVQVISDAAWLRGFVADGGASAPGTDIIAQLTEMAASRTAKGLRVHLHHHGLDQTARTRLAAYPRTCSALIEAAHEALTNVAKHAGVDQAVLRITVINDEILLTILDRGRGFDTTAPQTRFGLRHSIHGRIAEIGGAVRIESASDRGTQVEITAPLPNGCNSSRAYDYQCEVVGPPGTPSA
jgi:signal transduction histidine kinase